MTFQPGKSGNPAGRAKGKPTRRTVHVRKIIADNTGSIVKAIIDDAKTGDVAARQIFARYLMPRHRFVAEPVKLPPAKDLIETRAQIAKLASLAAEGVLDLDSMGAISKTLAMAAGLRLEELEELLADKEEQNHDNG